MRPSPAQDVNGNDASWESGQSQAQAQAQAQAGEVAESGASAGGPGASCSSGGGGAEERRPCATAGASLENADTLDRASSLELVGVLLARYPDRVPVVCRREPRSELPRLRKARLLPRGSMLCGEFVCIIRKLLSQEDAERKLGADTTIYLLVNRTALRTGTMLREVYERHRASDGFLYVTYGAENVLGGCTGTFGSIGATHATGEMIVGTSPD